MSHLQITIRGFIYIITTSGDTKNTLSLKMICSGKKYKIKVFTDAGKE